MGREQMPANRLGAIFDRRLWPWLALAAILVVYALVIVWLRPAANFGGLQDDAMYFASAKALAAGHGYLLPSFPGGLTALKYPELYPWLLSWIWRWDPSFPGNVVPAIGLSIFFGCWFLAACFLLAKRTLGLGEGWALAVTALCAFNFFVLLLGGSVLSDLPFGALALTAALAADRSLERDGHLGWMALAGLLAGISVGLRTVGVTVVAGIALVALVRRDWRKAALVCAVGGALSLPWIVPPALRLLSSHSGMAATSPGWRQTLAFYTSYIGQWRHFVPDWGTQRAVLLKNFFSIVLEPGVFLLYPLANHHAFLSVVGGLVALGAWLGILYHLRRVGWKAIHGMFLFYLAMVLPWPFPPQRFLVPFLPLLAGGAVLAFRELALHAVSAFRRRSPVLERAGAAALGACLLALAALVVANCAYAAPQGLSSLMARQRSLLAEKRKAYRWIRAHTPAQSRFIAYGDVLLYLYTGRQAVRPIACSTAAAYDNDPAYAHRDASHLGDVARHVAANYWLVTPTDFGGELGDDPAILSRAQSALLARLPLVFRDDAGRIRIYDLRCFQSPAAPGCALPAGSPAR